MAKCTACNSRKGKRLCKASNTLICSICCGTTRNQDKCDNCSFYSNRDESKNYSKVPYFEIRVMANDFQIQSIAELIERGLCICDEENNIDDTIAKSIVERLLDKYHFQENSIVFENGLEEVGFSFVNGHIEKNFQDIPGEVISKVLSTVLRSIKRHTTGGREYLDFTHQFVGMQQSNTEIQ
jgi:hypothetical protein